MAVGAARRPAQPSSRPEERREEVRKRRALPLEIGDVMLMQPGVERYAYRDGHQGGAIDP